LPPDPGTERISAGVIDEGRRVKFLGFSMP
jgi:hypothetical protein